MSETKYKRKWGDRRDARRVKCPGLQTIMGHLMPMRTDNEVFMNDSFDVTELMEFVAEKNKEDLGYRITPFYCLIMAMAKMVKERPLMNRFYQGHQLYERNEISISFVAKRQFSDAAEESLMFFVPKDEDTIYTLGKKIAGDVSEVKKHDKATGGIDEVLDKFAKIPRLLLMFIVKVIKWLDFWGVNPKALTDGDPNYSTILCSNLGSIQGPAVYHHLNNYGTCSIIVTIGTIHDKEVINPDGTKEIRKYVDIGATLDERIADGFYFIRSLKLIKHICRHPELLERPLGENSGYDYK
ncbi:MAG: 2-oxo acid dehydrogenase subunit E2 [Oscillospiraceae bacterium]|nr:2-oxo acid dehydrogenase subunit E2 [Oscillospiraceae bacterium]